MSEPRRYFCSGASCPGLPWEASTVAHPISCAAPVPLAALASAMRKLDAIAEAHPELRPHTSREVKHAAPAPLPEPVAGRLPTPEEMAADAVRSWLLTRAERTIAVNAGTEAVSNRDAAILARLDAIAKAADDGRLSALTMLDALRAELRGGAT